MGLPVNMAPFSKEDKILSMNVQLKHLMTVLQKKKAPNCGRNFVKS